MGAKVGRFVSLNGHEYEVRLEGQVFDAELEFGVPPVVVSMAQGEHKYCGFKSTTCTVNIVTDDVLTDLYANGPREVSLMVSDLTDGSVVFDGWVVPFSFDQPCTGHGDVVTVNAVDRLTAMKDSPYQSYGGAAYGTDVTALTMVKYICGRAGIMKYTIHLNFNDEADVMKSASPLDVRVAQAGFLQDEVSDVDALSAICKFFGYTAHVVGDTLYLYDEHCLRYGQVGHMDDANVYKAGGLVEHHYGSAASPLRRNVIGEVVGEPLVSVERAYDGVQITPEGREVSVLLPDVCAEDNLAYDGDAVSFGGDGDVAGKYYYQSRRPMVSKVMDLGLLDAGVLGDAWPDGSLNGTGWVDGARAVEVKNNTYRIFTAYGEDLHDGKWDTKRVVWVRPKYVGDAGENEDKSYRGDVGVQKVGCRYSHTGGLVAVKMRWGLLSDNRWWAVDSYEDLTEENIYKMRVVTIHCGSQELRSNISPMNPPRWVTERGVTELLAENYELLPTGIGQSRQTNDAVVMVPSDQPVWVSLSMQYVMTDAMREGNLYIESLSVEAVGDKIDTENEAYRVVYGDRADELLEVSTMLTTRESFAQTVNARPAVVTGVSWKGGYMGDPSKTGIHGAGVLMEQLSYRYGSAAEAYTLTVDGNIRPYAAVVWESRLFTVDAYDWDVADDVTTVVVD